MDANLLAVPSDSCTLGHLAIIVEQSDFKTLNGGQSIVEPNNPGPTATITGLTRTSTDAERAMMPYTAAECLRQYNYRKEEYNKFQATKNVARNMIVNAVEDKYICHLKHERTFYQNVQPVELMRHLWATYGMIDDDDITKNEERMKAQWNPPATIESLFQQLETGRAYAAKGKEIISDQKLYRWGYDNIVNTGLFDRPCKKWRNKDMADKTWETFKQHFTQAEKDRAQSTAKESGYTANAAEKIDIAAVVRDAVQQEISTLLCQEVGQGHPPPPEPPSLPPELEISTPGPEVTANAVTAKDIKRVVEEVLRDYDPPARNTRRAKRRRYNDTQHKAQAILDGVPVTYCYTHGITTNLKHNSHTCTKRCKGHDESATYQNRKGGSEVRCGEKQ